MPRRQIISRRASFVSLGLISGFLLLGSISFRHVQAQAPKKGVAPAVHLTGFLRPYGKSTCLSMAEQALQQGGLKLVGSRQVSERIGQNANAAVVVTCAQVGANQTRIVVIATSTDQSTADFYLTDIRTRLQRQVLIDNGSAGVPAST